MIYYSELHHRPRRRSRRPVALGHLRPHPVFTRAPDLVSILSLAPSQEVLSTTSTSNNNNTNSPSNSTSSNNNNRPSSRLNIRARVHTDPHLRLPRRRPSWTARPRNVFRLRRRRVRMLMRSSGARPRLPKTNGTSVDHRHRVLRGQHKDKDKRQDKHPSQGYPNCPKHPRSSPSRTSHLHPPAQLPVGTVARRPPPLHLHLRRRSSRRSVRARHPAGGRRRTIRRRRIS
jgi:hypothetical protein